MQSCQTPLLSLPMCLRLLIYVSVNATRGYLRLIYMKIVPSVGHSTAEMENRCTTCASWSSNYMAKYLRRIQQEYSSAGEIQQTTQINPSPSQAPSSSYPHQLMQVAMMNTPSGKSSRYNKQKGKNVPISSVSVSSFRCEFQSEIRREIQGFGNKA